MKRFLTFLSGAELRAGGLMAVAIVLVMSADIVARYFLQRPLVFSQELVMFLFLVMASLGAAAAMKTGSHIAIDTVTRLLPASAQRALRVVAWLLVVVCLVWLALTLPGVIRTQNMTSTASLPWNFPRGYYYSVPLLYACLSMLAAALYYLWFDLWALWGGPRDGRHRIGEDGTRDAEGSDVERL